MTHASFDRVRETTSTSGTGTVTLAGAVLGFRTFSSVLATSDTCYYAIVDNTTGDWETGLGTLASSTTLARTTILASSNAGSAVSLASGTKDVFLTAPAAQQGTGYWLRLSSAFGLTNGTSAQTMFGKSLTVPVGTYLIEAYVMLATGTTSHTVSVGMGGTATWTAGNASWYSEFLPVAAAGTPTAADVVKFNTTLTNGTTQVISAASTTASKAFKFTATIPVTGAGTLQPQIQFSAAPGGTNQTSVGSWCRITPTIDIVGAWA